MNRLINIIILIMNFSIIPVAIARIPSIQCHIEGKVLTITKQIQSVVSDIVGRFPRNTSSFCQATPYYEMSVEVAKVTGDKCDQDIVKTLAFYNMKCSDIECPKYMEGRTVKVKYFYWNTIKNISNDDFYKERSAINRKLENQLKENILKYTKDVKQYDGSVEKEWTSDAQIMVNSYCSENLTKISDSKWQSLDFAANDFIAIDVTSPIFANDKEVITVRGGSISKVQ